jgi:hypothetical protein
MHLEKRFASPSTCDLPLKRQKQDVKASFDYTVFAQNYEAVVCVE